ncbi:MAG: alpha/beta hydrolase [Planctomycetes bacterium]|nr:alpha/beta hydrolase [Planctomycetota bacterium]
MEIGSYTTSDGRTLRYREWRPEGYEALVVNLHGIQSHSGWFAGSCEHLARNGARVVSVDRRGSGLNEEDRGHAPGGRQLLDDLKVIVEQLRSEDPGKRMHLLGVCWGGKLAAALAGLHPELVDSLMLSSPGLAAKVRPGRAECVSIGICSLVWPRRLFRIPIDRAERFTSNPERIEFIKNDPMRLDQATARLMAESKRLDWLLKKVAPRIHAPTLLMLSGHDDIVDNERNRRIFDRFGSREKQIKTFDGAHHMLEFEPDTSQYFEILVRWIKTHS